MKKTLSLVLALITLLSCLSGCNNSKDIVLTDEDIHTDYAGVYLTLSSVDSSGEHKKLNAVWHNETTMTVTYGNWFVIEMKDGDNWTDVSTADVSFTEEAYIIKANKTSEKSYTTKFADISKEGTYRVRTEFYVQEINGASERGTTWIEFEVKKASTDKLDNIQPGGTDVHDVFDIRISWANWLEGTTVYEGCLNFNKMAISSVHHIPLHKFGSRSELDAFKARFGEDNSFDYGYNGKSFNENTADYDDAFFGENDLFLVYVDANSGSLQFDVNSIFNDGNSFCIYVNQTNNPEVVTDDMAGWFITVAVPKTATEQCTAFDAIMGYGSKHSLTVIDESGHLVDVNAPKEYHAGEVVTLKGELVYDTYLTFYVDDVRIDVEQENVDNYLYYSFVMPSKDTTVVCKLVSVSPPPAPQ
jgi:hypothetical protein